MSRLMLDVASLDKALFDDLEAAYDSVIEVQHVRESLIRFVESDEEHEKQFLETLPHYGLQEIDDALTALAKLYKTCTGEPLKYIRVR